MYQIELQYAVSCFFDDLRTFEHSYLIYVTFFLHLSSIIDKEISTDIFNLQSILDIASVKEY